MDINTTKRFLLACHTARHICESMPKLPPGISPRHIRTIDAIHQLEEQQNIVRVGDVSRLMNSTAPSITKLIHDLVRLGYVKKQQLPDDHRVYSLQLTGTGQDIYHHFVHDFHHWLNDQLSDLNEEDVQTAIRVITRVREAIRPVKERFPETSAAHTKKGVILWLTSNKKQK